MAARSLGDKLKSLWTRPRPGGPSPDEYRDWRAAQPALDVRASPVPYVVLLDPEDAHARTRLIAAFAPTADARAVLVRANGGWQRVPAGPTRPLLTWLAELDATSGWLWWISEPLMIEPGASRAIAEACELPGTRIVYADHDLADLAGRPALPVLKPAWDDEQLIEHNYPGAWLVVHPSLATLVDASAGAAGPWRALLEAAARLPPEAFVQVPRTLAHLPAAPVAAAPHARAREATRTAIEAVAAGRGDAIEVDARRVPWIRYASDDVSISLVVPAASRPKQLAACLDALHAGTAPGAELVVVEHAATDRRVARRFEAIARERPLANVASSGPLNLPRMWNAGVAAAKGRVVVLVDNATAFPERDWLDELASLAARARIGAAGPLVLAPDGLVQSAGVLVGANRAAIHALAGYHPGDAVALAWCGTRRRVSALVNACLAVERSKYFAVGGLDERFATSHYELDFCLRLDAAGFANLFTPYARVVHAQREGATAERGYLAEEAQFRSRWAHLVAATDPAHHPCLAHDGNPFALVAPPVDPRPRAGWRAPGTAPRGAAPARSG